MIKNIKKLCLEDILAKLDVFWKDQGCKVIYPSVNIDIGAATLNPEGTFFRVLKQKESKVCFSQQCVRPEDGTDDIDNKNNFHDPYRSEIFIQYQVLITPADSLEIHPVDLIKQSFNRVSDGFIAYNSVEILKDNWSSPSIGAFGVGYEVRVNGLEVAQITYITKMGGIDLEVPTLEISYGVDRLSMIINDLSSLNELNSYKKIPMLLSDGFKGKGKDDLSPLYGAKHLTPFLEPSVNSYKMQYETLIERIHVLNIIFKLKDVSHNFINSEIKECMDYAKKIAECFLKRNKIKINKKAKIKIDKKYISTSKDYFNLKNEDLCQKIEDLEDLVKLERFPNSVKMDDKFIRGYRFHPNKKTVHFIDRLLEFYREKYMNIIKKTFDDIESKLIKQVNKNNMFRDPDEFVNFNPFIKKIKFNDTISAIDVPTKKFNRDYLLTMYSYVELMMESSFAKEYGNNSKLFLYCLDIAISKYFGLSDSRFMVKVMLAKYYYTKLKNEFNSNGKFLRQYVSRIAETFYSISNMSLECEYEACNFNSVFKEIVDNSDDGSLIYNMIFNKYCSLLKNGKLIKKISNGDISKANIIYNFNLLIEFYEFYTFAKRLIPKFKIISKEIKNISTNENHKTNYINIDLMSDMYSDLAIPVSEYTEKNKRDLYEFYGIYNYLMVNLKLKDIIKDLGRIYGRHFKK